MRILTNVLLISTLFALFANAQNRIIRFSGKLARSESFRKEIDKNLAFALVPDSSDPGAFSGWKITVSPLGDHSPECTDLVWVVTPPYRGYNPTYIDTSYGKTAEEAMKFSPRDFKFVLNCSDYEQEADRVDRILWPYNYTEAQVDDALKNLSTSPEGSGELWIRSYKISSTPKLAGDKNLGQIDSISFDVEIRLPRR